MKGNKIMNKLKQFIARLAFKRIMERIRIQRFIRTASINKDSILAQYIKFLDADNREESMFYYNAFITTAFFKTYQECFYYIDDNSCAEAINIEIKTAILPIH